MKAYAYVDRVTLDCLRPVDLPDPTPAPDEIVVAMKAVALNYRDLAIATGDYHVQVAPPLIPLSDGAGEVVAIGASVTRFRVGDLVCPVYLPDWREGELSGSVARRRLGGPTDGVLRELMCASEQDFVRAPSHLSAEEAATLPVTAVTVWHSLFANASLTPGQTVLVQGAGGVSVAAVQLARAGGARVISVVRNDKHLGRLRELGASEVISRGGASNWAQDVIDATGGKGADVVVNVAGGETLAPSIAATALGGTIHLMGYASGKTVAFDMFEAIRHAATFRVAAAGSRKSFEAMTRVMELEDIRPPVSQGFAVTACREAFESLSRGGHFGKVILTF